MRIVIVVVGSRGDVQPCVALGAGLRDAGCDVLVAAPGPFEGFVTASGLVFTALPVDPSGLLGGAAGRAWVESGRSPIGFLRGLRDLAMPLLEPFADAVAAACTGADAIVYTTLAFPGWHVAQAAGVPAIQVAFAPVSPTAAFPPLLFPPVFAGRDPWRRTAPAALARAYHRAGHVLFAQTLWLPLRARLNAWRRSRLGLPPAGLRSPALQVERDGELLLQAFSPTVIPPPPDWGPHVVTTGYWFLDAPVDRRPPDHVAAFVADAPPPVSIGMGSMTGRDPAGLAGIAVEALRRTGQRGVLLSGWAELGATVRAAAPDDVDLLVVDELPHDWLFPRVIAAVHHGGAGTTAASLRAGTPTVVVPHFGDQPLWGDRVYALGAGPAPVPRRELTSRRLAHAISAAVHDTRIRDRAAEVGRAVRAERGVERAVERIMRIVQGDVRPTGPPR
jgi:UDP:flavonoid glycosyltransferase YjiC (YdhE family)